MFLRCLLLLSLSTTAFYSATATAEPKEQKLDPKEAAKKFDEANQHYKLQEFGKALDGFKELYRLTNESALLFNIAQCYRQMGDLEEALKQYKLFLQEDPNSDLRQNAQTRITEIEAAIKQKKDEEAAAKKAAEIAAAAASAKQEAAEQSSSNTLSKYFLLGAVGAGGASILTGAGAIVFGVAANKKIGAADGTPTVDIEQGNKLAKRAKLLAPVADGLAGLAVISGGVSYLLKKPSKSEKVSVSLSPGGAALTVQF